MGWASGSELFVETWQAVRAFIPEAKRRDVCVTIMRAFDGHDWDTHNEAFRDEWPEVEEAFYEINPELRDERA